MNIAGSAQRSSPLNYVRSRTRPSSSTGQIPQLVWPTLALLLLSLSPISSALGTTALILPWIIVALWALRGPGEAVESLLLTFLLTYLHPTLFTTSDGISNIARWLILALSAARVTYTWLKMRPANPPWFRPLFAFIIYVTIAAFFVSTWPLASLLKIIVFTLIVLTTYWGIALDTRDWYRNLIAFGIIITFLSLPLSLSPAGYAKNGTQFQGILNHPQSYGSAISALLAVTIGHWFLDRSIRSAIVCAVVATLMAITLAISGARTGYFALAAALALTMLAHQKKNLLVRLLFNPLSYFALAALIITLIIEPGVVNQLQTFVFERDVASYRYYDLPLDPASSPALHLVASRSALVARSWANFLQNPIFGIGIGMPSTSEAFAHATTLYGIPISLPVEKGFIGTGLLEEVGIVGTALFLLLIWSQLQGLGKASLPSPLLIYLTILLMNMGEFFYFAPGGIGLLVHVALAVALVTAERQKTGQLDTQHPLVSTHE